jgi:hypothetical protein
MEPLAMKLPENEYKKYREAWDASYGIELSPEDAQAQADKFFNFGKLLMQIGEREYNNRNEKK